MNFTAGYAYVYIYLYNYNYIYVLGQKLHIVVICTVIGTKRKKLGEKKTGLHSILTHNIVIPVKMLQRRYILLTVDTVNCQMFKGAYNSM